MHQYWVVLVALVSQVATFTYLKPWQYAAIYVKGYTVKRELEAFRAAGLL